MSKHILYTNADSDRPNSICDSDGCVVLGLCKRCNRAEIELSEPCELIRMVPNGTELYLITDEGGNHPNPALFNTFSEAAGFCKTFSVGGKLFRYKRIQVGMMEMRNNGWGLFN